MEKSIYAIYVALCMAFSVLYGPHSHNFFAAAGLGYLFSLVVPGLLADHFFNPGPTFDSGVIYGISILFWIIVGHLARLHSLARRNRPLPPPAAPQVSGIIRRRTYRIEED